MNARAAELGMTNTHYEDTSGISPLSVGSAADQLILAQTAMRIPVFAEIVRQQETDLPVAGVRSTTNLLLGSSGVVGIKTGRTEEAGGCFMIAMEREVAGERVLIVGVVLAQPSIDDAFAASRILAGAVAEGVRPMAVVRHGASVSSLEAAWGGSTSVTPAEDVTVLGWAGMPVQVTSTVESTDAPLAAGEEVGTLTVTAGGRTATVPLEAAEAIDGPSSTWRILRR
jgi:D-alanyl-D-alanine carboxypeptidase (penicillin-binding protein 5/6)